ncbi:MAG: T9SS type A sorting domain-containing protein [Flavobacteriales bacterium]|nr:T9SS type A sorting domain-containing protein [Flavobacteriales bacterium]
MRTTLLLFALLPLLAFAQSWCAPGATWTYGIDAFGTYGYSRYTYVSDTVLSGLPGQRLDLHTGVSSFFNDQVDFYDYPAAMITGLHEDVVALWSNTAQAWDTLFWLGAAPGDVFMRPFSEADPCEPMDHFVVQDTTTVSVGGMLLKRWSVVPVWGGNEYGAMHFIERLGWAWSMTPFPACLAVDGPAGLRCYSDQDISVNFTGLGCETLVGIKDHVATSRLSVFPNPGTTHFTLDLPPRPHTITLFDATGRMVLQQRTTDARPVIATEALPAGLYRIAVRDEQGGMMGATWVKE